MAVRRVQVRSHKSTWPLYVSDRLWRPDKSTRKSHPRPNRAHSVSLWVIGGVTESVWQGVGRRVGVWLYIHRYKASCIDPVPDSGGPDGERRRLITMSTDPGLLT